MRKLIILKSLVDFIWIVLCIPLIPLLLFFAVYMFIDSSILEIVNIKNEVIPKEKGFSMQLFVLIMVVVLYAEIYCFYLFRKTLRYFQKVQPFHQQVILHYRKIGNLLVYSALAAMVVNFMLRLILKQKIWIEIGFSSYLIALCLGLFFMILSEVFKVAKHAKEENELTV